MDSLCVFLLLQKLKHSCHNTMLITRVFTISCLLTILATKLSKARHFLVETKKSWKRTTLKTTLISHVAKKAVRLEYPSGTALKSVNLCCMIWIIWILHGALTMQLKLARRSLWLHAFQPAITSWTLKSVRKCVLAREQWQYKLWKLNTELDSWKKAGTF